MLHQIGVPFTSSEVNSMPKLDWYPTQRTLQDRIPAACTRKSPTLLATARMLASEKQKNFGIPALTLSRTWPPTGQKGLSFYHPTQCLNCKSIGSISELREADNADLAPKRAELPPSCTRSTAPSKSPIGPRPIFFGLLQAASLVSVVRLKLSQQDQGARELAHRAPGRSRQPAPVPSC